MAGFFVRRSMQVGTAPFGKNYLFATVDYKLQAALHPFYSFSGFTPAMKVLSDDY